MLLTERFFSLYDRHRKRLPNASAGTYLFSVPQGQEMLILIVIFLPLRYYYVIIRTQRASGMIRVFRAAALSRAYSPSFIRR